MRILFLVLTFLLSFSTIRCFAESEAQAASRSGSKGEKLLTIQRDIKWLENELEQKKKTLNNAQKDELVEVREEIGDLDSKLKKAKLTFIAVASDVELPNPDTEGPPAKRDLVQELQELVGPLLDAVRRVSEKPRRIESFRSKIDELNDQLGKVQKAIYSIDNLLQAKTYPSFEKQLDDSRQMLFHTRDELQVHLDSFQRKLDQELGDQRTVVQVISEATQGFFASKGRNLLIAIFVFALVISALIYLKHFIFRALRTRPKYREIAKPLQLLYSIMAGVIAISAVIITLHLLNDYFLVTVLILLLLAFAWSSKAVITHFINEVQLTLNLGTVKQGERVVWQGIPWLVKSLGFRSILENEALQGGTVMLSASALTTMLSRSIVEGEPWFPTLVGDYVLLDDGHYGQVTAQTPEMVILKMGKTTKYYSTLSFLAKNPQNFSRGFGLETELVIRHTTPLRPLDEIRPQLLRLITQKLESRLSGAEPALANFKVQTRGTGPHMTRVWLTAECSGSMAGDRDALKREMLCAAGEAWRDLLT